MNKRTKKIFFLEKSSFTIPECTQSKEIFYSTKKELPLPFGSKVLANSYSTVYENLISLKTKYRLTWSNFNWFVYLPDLTQIILKAGHLSFIIRQTKSFWFLSLLNSRHYNCDMSKHRGSEWDSPDSIFRMSSFFRYNFLIIEKNDPFLCLIAEAYGKFNHTFSTRIYCSSFLPTFNGYWFQPASNALRFCYNTKTNPNHNRIKK